jgi:uncharacterized LabA/DUF88 family protein
VALFIDVANLYYSARGQEVDVDYVALLKHATKGRDLIRAYAYSGLDPENENQRKFLDFLSKNGYKVVSKDIRKFGDGRVKANLDIELVVDLFRLADRMDIAVIVSGDGDFASAIRALQDVGVRCEVISFRPNTSSDLIAVADEFTDIMKILGIGRKKGDKGLSMPEMPAKEVNPEFGFRTASRDVAAAALAAIREGDGTPDRRRGGRSTRPRARTDTVAVPVGGGDEPVEPMTSLEAHAEPSPAAGDAEVHRRRRRRGGRGRGRGRRGLGEVASDETPDVEGEITWEELDDISQLGELTDLGEPGDERQYAFSEADPATLAELGIAEPEASVEPSAVEPEAAQSAPARSGRSRSGGRRPTTSAPSDAGEPDATGDAQVSGEGSAKAPARRARRTATSTSAKSASATPARTPRSRSAKSPAAGVESTSESGGADEKAPARRRRRSTKAEADAAAETSADRGGNQGSSGSPEDEGIWQRFRSGRRPTRSNTRSS